MRVTWLRSHVAVRNGKNSISYAFAEPEYGIVLKDKSFWISKNQELVTIIPIENIVEYTAYEAVETKRK